MKLEKVKKLMELVGFIALMKRDFDILRQPFGPIELPIELLKITPEEEEDFITKFAEMYGEFWKEDELDEAIAFLTENPAGKKLIDHLLKREVLNEFNEKFIKPLMEEIEPRFISILSGNNSIQ